MDWKLLRAWIQAEIVSEIASREEGADGYYGNNYVENKIANDLFEELTGESID